MAWVTIRRYQAVIVSEKRLKLNHQNKKIAWNDDYYSSSINTCDISESIQDISAVFRGAAHLAGLVFHSSISNSAAVSIACANVDFYAL